jgi:hypothetical protein
MRKYKYIGIFKSAEGDIYQLEVSCNGFLQAFFLLTADAIRSGKHYQLYSITNEKGEKGIVDLITKCNFLIEVED